MPLPHPSHLPSPGDRPSPRLTLQLPNPARYTQGVTLECAPAEAVSTYLTPICQPNKRELELVEQLATARRKLEHLLDGHTTSSKHDWKHKAQQAIDQLQQLVAQLEELVEQHQGLQRHRRMISMHIELAEQEHKRIHQPVPLVSQTRLLAPPPDMRPSCSAAVSVLELPAAASWSPSWDEAVRGLQRGDLLNLHRQWLQHSSVLLPKVQMLGSTPAGAAATRQLHDLYAKYDHFSQRVMRLAPAAWNDMVRFDLDTRQLLPAPPTAQSMAAFWPSRFPDLVPMIFPVIMHYRKILIKLQEEQVQLQQRHAELCAGRGASLDGGGPGPEPGGPPCSSWVQRGLDVEVDDVLRQLQANLLHQELQQAAFYHALNYAIPAHAMLKVRLVLYPLAINGQVLSK